MPLINFAATFPCVLLGPLVALAAVCLLGCDRNSVVTTPVEGRITYGGGDWPAPGILYFVPLGSAGSSPQRPGTAAFAQDGRFKATTLEPGDGLNPGKYYVNIECWKVPPSLAPNAPPPQSYVPAEFYQDVAGRLQIEVPAGGEEPLQVNFDLPAP